VTREDIERWRGPPARRAVLLREGRAYLGLPTAVETDPAGNPLTGQDPIRFGRGSILSFSPTAQAPPDPSNLRSVSGNEAWPSASRASMGRIRTYRWWKGNGVR